MNRRQEYQASSVTKRATCSAADGDPAASWIEEGGALVFSDAKFSQITLDAHKLHVAIKVTEELLYDNVFNLEDYIVKKFAEALSNAEEDAFLNGNGTGKPTGIFDVTAGGTVAEELATATLKADNIMDLIYDLKRPYRKKARFITNDKTIALIRKLKDNNGAYLWQPSLVAGEPDKVLGYPIHTSAFCPQMEAGKPFMAFGDFSYYKIGDRGTRSFAELKELFAGNGMVALGEISNDIGITKILTEIFGRDETINIMNIICYIIVSQSTTFQHYPFFYEKTSSIRS